MIRDEIYCFSFYGFSINCIIVGQVCGLQRSENFEGNRKPSVLPDDVYEVLLHLVEGKAQPPVKELTRVMCDNGEPAEGYQSKRTMVTKHYIKRGVER